MYKYSNPNLLKMQQQGQQAGAADRVSGSARPASLSNGHICPQELEREVIFYKNGSRFEVKRPNYKYQGKAGGGERGYITGFSRKSRRRLMYKMGEIDKGELPTFVTLTYPELFPTDPVKWKADLNNFYKRLKRKFPKFAMVWKLEPQKRGAPHFHLLVWGAPMAILYNIVPDIWYEVVGSGDRKHLLFHWGVLGNGNQHCVSAVRSWRGVMAYASKYLGKECTCEGWDSPGRFWGIKGADCIPWAEVVKMLVGYQDGYKLIRLMRRYAKLKSRAYQSLSIFCNPNYWMMNMGALINSS